jgi:hypothetical protein
VLHALIAEIRRRAYSIRTEQADEHWACRFIAFCRNRDPRDLGAAEVGAFLEDLAVRGNVAASTQNQALNALVFLYAQVLKKLEALREFVRAKRPRRLPVVLMRAEVGALRERLSALSGSWRACSTARGCVSWSACAFESRTSISTIGRSWSETPRAPRTEWFRSPRPCTRPSVTAWPRRAIR